MEPVTGMESKLALQDPRRGKALSVSGAKGKRDLNATVQPPVQEPRDLVEDLRWDPHVFLSHFSVSSST